ncbi:juvenile hormone esterase-like isoform X2 [Schistocerca gregaria]|uniref:juvenile hormone esterase-like isoform X2 n=1 Tax=Schistocerca gregaria TaxID=7010 RepID=UPI00211E3DCC|nr:juvenile hormone esterase-like isoform X2 [Schistocerca gregaria]
MSPSSRLAAALPLVLVVAVVVAASPVVRTRQGAVRGRYQPSCNGRQLLAFHYLPYAQPPVGQLRFRDPQPPDGWVHIRDATVRGPDCVQNDDFFFHTGVSGSEDCLYLNVYTPELSPSSPLPVMFWVHGGGFFYGGGSVYGPDFLLDHDVVLVTINYRLGTLGFLSTEDEAAPGNFGLKDQVAALRWVQENIAAFGGDPDRVTIFGESAGAACVHLLALSPLARGLFHRVIMESGSALAPWTLARNGESAARAREVAAYLGCPTQPHAAMVDCLRGVDDHKLLLAGNIIKKWGVHPAVLFHPVEEAATPSSFLPGPSSLLKPAEVDWMVGVNENEGGLFCAGFYANSSVWKEFESNLNTLLPITIFYDTARNADVIGEKIREFYFPSGSLSLKGMTELYSDVMFIWGSDEAVRRYRNTASVYYYYFTYRGKYRTADPYRKINFDFGAGHTDELFYLFPKNPFYPENYELPEEDRKIVDTLTKLWTNFAKTGNPTPDGESVTWPKVASDDEPEYLEIGKELKAKRGFAKKRMEFWRSVTPLWDFGTVSHLMGTQEPETGRGLSTEK